MTTTAAETLCKTCQQPFEPLAIELFGRQILGINCQPCVAVYEAETAKRELAGKMEGHDAEALWAEFCPREHRLTSETSGATEMARLASECSSLAKIIGWQLGRRGLIVRGVTGTCKTRAVWRLLRRLFDEGTAFVAMTSAEFRRSYTDAAGTFETTGWFKQLAEAPVLFIDDLGQGEWTENVKGEFFDLIDKRTREHRPVIVTTNYDGESMKQRFGTNQADPLVRRLRDYCESVVVKKTL
jgi:DNA replication protein DnaC